ncbi:MAG TPA: hypothetical protein VEQ37_08135 [Actinomycetota bacterium]|nr:hypothetical protein [Actinomycetota bacterium]
MRSSKVTVFPVPVTQKSVPAGQDPGRMSVEIERLRAENTLLRQRLAAVETIAFEREETIADLRRALQMLPSVWAEKLEGNAPVPEEAGQPAGPPAQAVVSPPRPVAPPDRLATAHASAGDSDAAIDQAEAFFAEVAALRVRLERKRLEAEQEILEQERTRLLADIEWTRKWQRSRRVHARPTEE